MRKGWVDYIVPQIYWNIGHQAADYAELTHWWGKHTPQKKAQLYIGQHAARTMDGGQLEEKLALSRQNSSGNSWWSGEDLVKNYKGLGDSSSPATRPTVRSFPRYTVLSVRRRPQLLSASSSRTPTKTGT